MFTRRVALLALPTALLAACTSVYAGQPTIVAHRAANYWIWHDGVRWHLQITPGHRPHRFHGFVTTDGGGGEATSRLASAPTTLRATDSTWRDGSSQSEHGVAFDVTTDQPGGISWVGSYAGFDVAIDGIYRPRRVRLGATEAHPVRVPFTVDAP